MSNTGSTNLSVQHNTILSGASEDNAYEGVESDLHDQLHHHQPQLDPNEDEIDVIGQPDEGNYNTVRIPGHSGPDLTGKVGIRPSKHTALFQRP